MLHWQPHQPGIQPPIVNRCLMALPLSKQLLPGSQLKGHFVAGIKHGGGVHHGRIDPRSPTAAYTKSGIMTP